MRILVILAMLIAGPSAATERYVMITHTKGTDEFWPVVEKGGMDAAAALGVDFEFLFTSTGDAEDIAELVRSVLESPPDGLIISVPDADILGPEIRKVSEAGVPVITINSGQYASAALGAIMHIGGNDHAAGRMVGETAREEGGVSALCLWRRQASGAFSDRCRGFVAGFVQPVERVEISGRKDLVEPQILDILANSEDVDTVVASAPELCLGAAEAIEASGKSVYLACFDLTPDVVQAIRRGTARITVDQQPRLQGYLPVVMLYLFNTNLGLLPRAGISTGPRILSPEALDAVAGQAGVNR